MKYAHLCLLLLISLHLACDKKTAIIDESGSIHPVTCDKMIVAGWVSFSSIDLSVYNIPPEHKQKQEYYINRGLFQHSLKKRLRDYTVLFASSARSAYPPKGDIYIQCTPMAIEKRWDIFKGGSDYLRLKITFTDLQKKKVLYTCTVQLPSQGSFHGSYMDRITKEMDNAAQFLSQLIIHGAPPAGQN